MKKPLRLKDIYKTPYISGIFQYMTEQSEVMNNFFNDIIDSTANNIHTLDIDYIFNRSGDKRISVLLENVYANYVIDDNDNYCTLRNGKRVTFDSDEFLKDLSDTIISNIIAVKFYKKWTKLYKALNADYDALKPYSMQLKDDLQINRTNDGTNTRDFKETNNDSTYGFNSVTETPTDNSVNTDTGTGTTHSTSEDKHDRTINRSGNIGNKSAMQLLEEELHFRKNIIIEEIYNDLDSVLTRNHY